MVMKRLLLASLLTTLNCAFSSRTHAAPISAPPAQTDRLAQIYMGDTPMITTYGMGTIVAPADTATLNYTLSRYNYYLGDTNTGSDTEIIPFSLTDRDQVLAFFVAQGIPEDQIEINLSSYDMYITLEIRDPEQSALMALEDATEQFANADSSFYFTNNYSTCSIEELAGLETDARIEAIADARSRVDAMANAVGAEVGSVLSMIEIHGYMPTSSPCNAPDGGIGVPEVKIELGVMTTFELID
jgi:uncharacterized protein YggE